MKKFRNYEKTITGQDSTDRRKESKEDIGMIMKQMEEMQKKLNQVDTKWKRMEEDLKEFIAKTVIEVMEEREEKQKRMKNVVIFNLREPDTGNLSMKEKKEQEQAMCMDIIANELGVEEVQIMETIRLGKQEHNVREGVQRPRALLVKLTDVQTKWEIVKIAKKLKEAKKEEYRNVYIVPDLTLKERAAEKVLRDQLKQKREQGEKGWFIRKGQLIRGNFQ